MKELTPEEAYLKLGKPTFKKLEGMVKGAEALLLQDCDALMKQATLGLVGSYFAVMEWLDTAHEQAKVRGIIGTVSENIAKLKETLLDNERVIINGDHEVEYAIVDSYGNAIQNMASTDSLAIAQSMNLGMDKIREIVEGKSDKVLDEFFDGMKRAVERADRLKVVQAEVAVVAKVLPKEAFITIRRGAASVEVDLKSTKALYRARLKELQK